MNKFKLFLLRYKDRIIRFLIAFSVLSSLVLSSFSVGAVTPMWFLCDKPQITNTSAYVEVVDGSGKGYVFYLIGSDGTNTVSSNVNLGFKCSIDSDGYLYFKVDEDLVQNGFTCHSFYVNQGNQVTATPYWPEGGYSYIRLYSISYIMGYNCDVSAVPTSYNDYSFYYSGDVIISDKLNTISDILRSVNTNVTTQSELTRAKLQEVLYCNSNLEKIDGTLKSILDDTNNIDSNLLKVLEILQAAENGTYYNPNEDGTAGAVTNQQQADEQVMQGTATGQVETNNAISGLSGLLTTTGAVFKGSTALTKVFNLFAQSAYMTPILQISLVLGISSFVLGSAFIVVGKIKNNRK